MTGTTHQMVALVIALWLLTLYPITLGPVLAVLAIVAVMVGALTPDLDHPTAHIFRRMIGGRLFHRLFSIFSGGHRHFTHSILGIFAIGWVLRWIIFHVIQPEFQAEALVVWNAFMIGYVSHPLADTLTDQGVPWFWPIRWNVKIPPGPEELRVTTESFVETILVRGALIVVAMLLLSSHGEIFLQMFR